MRRSETTIEERLRAALTAEWSVVPEGVDMSAAAITQRLRELCEMSSLCLALLEVGVDNARPHD